ncbi:hypothetical protein G7046_g1009 [Stylonectria norvegica]|nr:hypothetical protein G7046_g1009 [Stylonectria norvegica]
MSSFNNNNNNNPNDSNNNLGAPNEREIAPQSAVVPPFDPRSEDYHRQQMSLYADRLRDSIVLHDDEDENGLSLIPIRTRRLPLASSASAAPGNPVPASPAAGDQGQGQSCRGGDRSPTELRQAKRRKLNSDRGTEGSQDDVPVVITSSVPAAEVFANLSSAQANTDSWNSVIYSFRTSTPNVWRCWRDVANRRHNDRPQEPCPNHGQRCFQVMWFWQASEVEDKGDDEDEGADETGRRYQVTYDFRHVTFVLSP